MNEVINGDRLAPEPEPFTLRQEETEGTT